MKAGDVGAGTTTGAAAAVDSPGGSDTVIATACSGAGSAMDVATDACAAAAVSIATRTFRRRILVSMAMAVAARFRVRPRGWSRLLPRRNRLLSMASCQSAEPNLYRSGSAIGAQSLTSGISGARRAASGAARGPSTHLRIRPNARTGMDASFRPPRGPAPRG